MWGGYRVQEEDLGKKNTKKEKAKDQTDPRRRGRCSVREYVERKELKRGGLCGRQIVKRQGG